MKLYNLGENILFADVLLIWCLDGELQWEPQLTSEGFRSQSRQVSEHYEKSWISSIYSSAVALSAFSAVQIARYGSSLKISFSLRIYAAC